MLDDDDLYNSYEADYEEEMLDELTGTTSDERLLEFWRRINEEIELVTLPLPLE